MLESKCRDKIWELRPWCNTTKIGELRFNSDIRVAQFLVSLKAFQTLSFDCLVEYFIDNKNQMVDFKNFVWGKNKHFFEANNSANLKSTIKKWIILGLGHRLSVKFIGYKIILEIFNPQVSSIVF